MSSKQYETVTTPVSLSAGGIPGSQAGKLGFFALWGVVNESFNTFISSSVF